MPPTGSSAATFTRSMASCHFRLAGLRPLVLTQPSGPSAARRCSVRGCPCPESRRCSGTDPSQRIGRRRQDAEAQSASSERRPWMAVANVRRRGMGSPEPCRWLYTREAHRRMRSTQRTKAMDGSGRVYSVVHAAGFVAALRREPCQQQCVADEHRGWHEGRQLERLPAAEEARSFHERLVAGRLGACG